MPTTSGTGAEVTPFAVITDTATGKKYPLAGYALTPSVAIVAPVLAALPEQARNAYEDQCAPANPRMPMLDDMRDLMRAAYHGRR